MARLLLEHGANPDTAPESSGSALSHTRNDPEMRKLLIEFGAREEPREMDELAKLFEDGNVEELEKRQVTLPAGDRWYDYWNDAQPMAGGSAPARPPMTMFCGVRRFSHIVYTKT